MKNNVVDALSRDFDCSACELTNILRKTCPSQLPKHFQIAPLPNEISSWLPALLLKLPVQEQLQEVHTKTTLRRGTISPSTLEASDSATTSSSTPLHELNETISSESLQWLSGKDAFCWQLMTNWLREQSEIPSQIFLQPLGKTGGKRTKRMTPQHSWHLTMSPSAQYEQQPPSYIESNPTQEPTKTPQFPQSGGLLRGSNGDVPWWMPSLPNHDDRSLVQRCLPVIHSQAS